MKHRKKDTFFYGSLSLLLKTIASLCPICLLFFLLLFSCKPESPPDNNATGPKTGSTAGNTPEFNADSALAFTKVQVDFGPRIMNSVSHERCGQYLSGKLKLFADSVYIQKTTLRGWDSKMLNVENIIASFSPEKNSRVILCSHWDTRPWADQDSVRKNEPPDGANDGAAGVAVLLEIARLLKNSRPNIGVDIILFDAEDYGQGEDSGVKEVENSWCLGSQYWSHNPHITNYFASYGILLDMIGAKDAVFTQEAVSEQYASSVNKKVWDAAAKLGYSDFFVYEKTHPLTDDHYYINVMAGIPCIDIIENDKKTSSHFYKNWHTHQDNIEFIDKKSLKAVGQTLLEVVFTEK